MPATVRAAGLRWLTVQEAVRLRHRVRLHDSLQPGQAKEGNAMKNRSLTVSHPATAFCIANFLLLAPLVGLAQSTRIEGEATAATLPAVVLGVWHRDDASGRGQCGSYRALPKKLGESDAGWMAMVGSIVVTPALVHEFSEYGEGGLNVVREVSRIGIGDWRVKVQEGIDSMPDADAEVESYVLEFRQQQRLYWQREGTAMDGVGYFRCGDVRSDEDDADQGEDESLP